MVFIVSNHLGRGFRHRLWFSMRSQKFIQHLQRKLESIIGKWIKKSKKKVRRQSRDHLIGWVDFERIYLIFFIDFRGGNEIGGCGPPSFFVHLFLFSLSLSLSFFLSLSLSLSLFRCSFFFYNASFSENRLWNVWSLLTQHKKKSGKYFDKIRWKWCFFF